MKPGPKKRAFGRLTVSLGKGQRRELTKLAGADYSLAQVVRFAVDHMIASGGAALPHTGGKRP